MKFMGRVDQQKNHHNGLWVESVAVPTKEQFAWSKELVTQNEFAR